MTSDSGTWPGFFHYNFRFSRIEALLTMIIPLSKGEKYPKILARDNKGKNQKSVFKLLGL